MEWILENDRLYAISEEECVAEATFQRVGEKLINIDHTFVSPLLRGQGIASEMMQILMQYVEKEGLQAVATCPYAKAWLQSHSTL